jgi:hypothetical protein
MAFMTNTRWLAKLLRWVFFAFEMFLSIGAVAIAGVLLVDPKLPADAAFGPTNTEIMGQPGSFVFHDSTFAATLVNGGLNLRVDSAAGLFELVKHVGLPVALLSVLFLIAVFELLRRLFRNVVRGESFTPQTVRLVQGLGLTLLVYSFVSAVAEGWLQYALYTYLSQHATIWISGTAIHLPHTNTFTYEGGSGSPFGSPLFFLVLALSEVFRQGLALKNENDLTV